MGGSEANEDEQSCELHLDAARTEEMPRGSESGGGCRGPQRDAFQALTTVQTDLSSISQNWEEVG